MAKYKYQLFYALAIVAFSMYFLVYKNSDMLFMAQSRSLFYNSEVFFNDCMKVPGGLLAWCGSFLTQFLYEPALGASLLTALWLLLFFLIKAVFHISDRLTVLAFIPAVCLLASEIDLGYWVYYLKMPGYYFRETLGFIALTGLLALGRLSAGKWAGVGVCLLMALTYPLLGAYSLLALLITALRKPPFALAGRLTAIGLLIVTPILFYQVFPEIRLQDAWTAGFPLFLAETTLSLRPSYPFLLIVLCLIAYDFLPRMEEVDKKTTLACHVLGAALVALSFAGVQAANVDDYNYHAEMRMYRAVDEQRWDDVLREAAKAPDDVTRQMVMLRNIALFNKGVAGNQMFHYNNMGKAPYVYDSLRVHMVQTAAPMIYLHHGKTNFSLRWCIENSVEYDYCYDNLKLLSVCSLLHGEWEAARKYLDILSNTIYYKDWAEHYMPITEDPSLMRGEKLKTRYPELVNIVELRDHMGSTLDGDNGLCEMYILNYFSNTMNKDSKYLQEITLDYALMQKDIQLFWPHFMLYATLNQDIEMPIHYQEAAYLYGNLEPQSMDISRMPFDKTKIVERYASFNQTTQSMIKMGMDTKQVGEATKAAYGDTFWWFYFFCRDVHSY